MTNGQITNSYEYAPANGGKAESLVVLLHGVGSNGQDLITLAPLWAANLPKTVFVSPDAPFACDMVPPGYPNAYQWFSLQDRDPEKMLKGLEVVAPLVNSFIAEQMQKYGIAPEKVALVGFSQGTMTSLYVAPRFPQKLAGVLGYSGALIWGADTDKDHLQHFPVCLVHGEADDVVPVEASNFARQTLQEFGYNVSGHTTPGLTHSIDEKGLQAGAKFLQSLFS